MIHKISKTTGFLMVHPNSPVCYNLMILKDFRPCALVNAKNKFWLLLFITSNELNTSRESLTVFKSNSPSHT